MEEQMMVHSKRIRSEFVLPVMAVLFVLLSGCDSVSTRWHKYQNDRVEVRGMKSDEIVK